MQSPGPAVETAIGGTLLSSPYWAGWLHDINAIAATIATVGGAVIAVHGVARIVVGLVERTRRPPHPFSSANTGDDDAP